MMNLQYFRNEDKQTNYVVATSDSYLPGGMEPSIAYGLVQRNFMSPKDVFVPIQIRAKAKPHGADVYDAQVGDEIARDKVLVRYYGKVSEAYDAYIEALEKELERARGTHAFAKSKVEHATERLAKHEG